MKKGVWIILALILIGLSAFFGSDQLDQLVAKRLNKMLIKQENELYHYQLEEFDLKFFKRELLLKGVRIIPKTSFLDSLKDIRKAKSTIYSIDLEAISIQDLNPISVFFSKEIAVGKIRLESPKVKLFKADTSISEKQRIVSRISNQKQLFSDLINGQFKRVYIETISIAGAETEYYKVFEEDTALLMRSEKTDFNIHGLATDQDLIQSSEVFEYDSTSFNLRGMHWEGNENYRVHLGQFKKTTDNDHLIFKQIRITPREDKFSFMRDQVQEVDWFKCGIDQVVVLNFDIRAFQRNQSLSSTKLRIKGADIEIYRDKRLRDENSIKPLIGSVLKDLEFDLGIDSLVLYESNLNYYEWEVNAKEPIHAEIEDINIQIVNLTNKFQNMIESDTLKLKATANFMDKGQLEVESNFILSDTNDLFKLQARIEHLPLPALNPLLKESAFIEFKDGKLDWVEMEMTANDYLSESRMDMQYSNLKHFDLLRGMDEVKVQKEKGNHVSRKRKFLSFIIREVIPNDYGPGSPNYQTAYYQVERNRSKSIVNYLVENLKSGSKAHLQPEFLKKKD